MNESNAANLVNIPYDTNITTEIATVVCDSKSESVFFRFAVGKCYIMVLSESQTNSRFSGAQKYMK